MKKLVVSFLAACLLVAPVWARPNSVDWQKLPTYREAPKQTFQFIQSRQDPGLSEYRDATPSTRTFSLYENTVAPNAVLGDYRKPTNNDKTFKYYPSGYKVPTESTPTREVE